MRAKILYNIWKYFVCSSVNQGTEGQNKEGKIVCVAVMGTAKGKEEN